MRRRLLASLSATAAVAASLLIGSAVPATAADTAVESSSATADRSSGVTPNAKLPEAIRVDETKFKIVATLRGVGKQVYDCEAGAYKFREPIATLSTLRGAPAGIHGAGPFWANFDGSKFIGTGAISAPSPVDPDKNIPGLKVAKSSTAGTGGVFSNVEIVQRTDTRGGVAPKSCGAPTVAVDYSTIYVFWAPK